MNTVMDESTIVERILNHDHKEKNRSSPIQQIVMAGQPTFIGDPPSVW